MKKNSLLNSEEFFMAVELGDLKEIAALLEAGVNPNLKDRDEKPVLHLAASDIYSDDNDAWEAVDLLLKRGANIEAQDKEGWTVFLYACAIDNPGQIKGLIKRGANIKARNKKGETPVDTAKKTWWLFKHYFLLLSKF